MLIPFVSSFGYSSSSLDVTGILNAQTFPIETQRSIGRPFGASLHFPGELENDLDPESTTFAECEFGWTRTCNFMWSFMEPEQDNFSPITDSNHYSNKFLQNMKSINCKVLPLIDGPPTWLNEGSTFYISPDHIDLLCRYVNETVTAYQNDMKIWELFNEPNNAWGKIRGTWEEFFAILIATAETIKLANDSLEILVGGLGGERELEYLDALMANLTQTPTSVPGYATAKDLFIGIAFHPYSNPPENLAVKLHQYNEVLEKYHWTAEDGARHWITEIGGETDSPRDGAGGFLVDAQKEFAAMVLKQMSIAVTWQVDGFNIWTYRDFEPPGSYLYDFGHCGIVYSDASPKPAALACKWANKNLGNGHMTIMPVNLPNPVTGIVVKDAQLIAGKERWTFVLWNSQHQGYVNLKINLGTSIDSAQKCAYDSESTSDISIPASTTSMSIQVGYEPVLLNLNCTPGGICTVEVLSDPIGFIVLLTFGTAIVVVIANLYRSVSSFSNRRCMRKGGNINAVSE